MKFKKILSVALSALICATGSTLVGCSDGEIKAFEKGTPKTSYKTTFRGIDQDTMPISGYIGPSDSYQAQGYMLPSLVVDKTYKDLSAAGVNLIIEQRNPYNASSADASMDLLHRMLTHAGNNNISYLIKDTTAAYFDDGSEFVGSVEDMKTAIQRFYEYESFAGFYFRDEPTAILMDKVGQAVDNFNTAINELGYTDLQAYYNMLPPMGSSALYGGQAPTDLYPKGYTYEDYIQSFVNMSAGVNYLMFDQYPIAGGKGEVASNWFNTLGRMNSKAIANGLMWMGYAQVGGTYGFINNRFVDEYEYAWNINSMLAFGAKGIGLYLLCMPPEYSLTVPEESVYEVGIINKYGNKTPMWYWTQKITKNIFAMDHVLMNARHEGVIISGKSPCNYDNGTFVNNEYETPLLSNYRGLESVSGDPALVGCFDYKGGMALLVMNNTFDDHRGEITLKFDEHYAYEVIQRGISAETDGEEFTLHLEAGEAALVVVK